VVRPGVGDVKVFFSPTYAAAGHAFDTTRKAAWVAQSLQRDPIPHVRVMEPEAVTETQLCTVHDPAYVAAVKTGEPCYLAETQGFTWDPGLWQAVCSSTGGVLAAAQAALHEGVAGSLSSGLHHARRSAGAGYCTFNGLALAALEATSQGSNNVLIMDFDAHCGGGTHSLISTHSRIRQADISVSPFDRYQPTGDNRLELVVDASQYLSAIEQMLAEVERQGNYQLCLYNAGMDPHENCPVGGLPGITTAMLAERERMVFEWCHTRGCPVAFVLAGGYIGSALSRDDLVALHRLTIKSAGRDYSAALAEQA
jgi:acetoin utilization deacetylase AcuC-like enzyme